MTFEQLIYFSESNKYHSFSAAANALYVSQSTISMSVAALEIELGFKLFIRSKKGLLLTSQGEYILESVQTILHEKEIIQNYAMGYHQNMEGLIRIGSAQFFSNKIMPSIIEQLIMCAPKLQLRIIEDTHLEIINNIFSYQYDLGIIGFLESQSAKINSLLQEKNLNQNRIAQCEFSCCVNHEHPLKNKELITADDLVSYQIIVHTSFYQSLSNYLSKEVYNIVEVNNYSLFDSLLSNNKFIAIIPCLLHNMILSNNVCCKQNFFPEQVYYSIISNKSNVHTNIQFVISTIEGYFANNDVGE